MIYKPVMAVLLWLILANTACGVTPVADEIQRLVKIRYSELIGPDSVRRYDRPQQIATAALEFYAFRQYHPVWSVARLHELISALDGLVDDGLHPEDYQRTLLAQLSATLEMPQDQPDRTTAELVRWARVDLLATESLLKAIEDLSWGKVEPEPPDSAWTLPARHVEPEERLRRLRAVIDTPDLQGGLYQMRPQHRFYRQLQQGLRELHGIARQGGWPQLPEGITLKPGMTDQTVAILRQRLLPDFSVGSVGSVGSAGIVKSVDRYGRTDTFENYRYFYDSVLEDAVKAYQRAQYLEADGAVGRATREMLNVSVQQRIDQVRVNLERARWLLQDVPEDFVLVDIAGYKISYYRDHEKIWSSRVQVGKPYRSTPVFRSAIDRITLNPTWTVPPTILNEDVLPAVRKDPAYLERNNIRVFDRSWNELPPDKVDWLNPGAIRLRQNAGPSSALGRAAIRFPNHFAIYLHDTPHQQLFAKSQRAFSSGCIRVERVMELVELLLADTPNWGHDAISQQLDSEKTRNVTLSQPVPIFIAYWTVDASAEGHISFKPDIYERDFKLLERLAQKR